MADSLLSWQWLVRVNDVKHLWAAQPTYLISQALFLLGGLLTFIHAIKKGGRWPYLWITAIFHGLFSDNIWHILITDMENFWHSQTPVMLFGSRLPLHIMLLYAVFIYLATYSVAKLKLPAYAEHFAVGLMVVLLDLPYDIASVKFVHWTWHDTDPNVFDRHYWVPWTSYFFHAAFAASLSFFFHTIRKWLAPKVSQWESAGAATELKALIAASLLGMPGGVLLFVSIYHPLHDFYGIHTEVAVFAMFSLFAVFVVNGLVANKKATKDKLDSVDYLVVFQITVHYLIFLLLVIFGHPENEVSTGLHQPIGPCNEVSYLTTPFGQTLAKGKYLCLSDYDEGYFDLHCAPHQKLVTGQSWYTICGKPFENRVEYITVIGSITALAAGVFYAIFSTNTPLAPMPTKKVKSK